MTLDGSRAKASLLNFWAAVGDYAQLSNEVPLSNTISIGYRREDDPSMYWDAVLHAAVLRKFFSGDPRRSEAHRRGGDPVTIWKIVDVCKCALGDRLDADLIARFDAVRLQAVQIWDTGSWRYQVGAGPMELPGELVRRILYGHHLHGEGAKRERLGPYPDGSQLSALHNWITDAQNRLEDARVAVWSTFQLKAWSELGEWCPLQLGTRE